MKISIAGAGVFGTAIANSIARKHDIILYSRQNAIVEDINRNRKNSKFFPNKTLSKKISATSNIKDLEDSDVLFLCLPSYAVIDFIKSSSLSAKTLIVNGAKGFGDGTKLIFEAIACIIPNQVVSLKGPSFANELIYEMPTGFTLASPNIKDLYTIGALFRKGIISLDYSEDVRGIELISIIKNIYAILIGIVDATYNSANVRFMVFTKAAKEIRLILHAFGCSSELLLNYAGVGDFGLTALNDLSRNRTLGLLIGKGFLNAELGNSVILEGVKAIDKILELLHIKDFEAYPIIYHLNLLLQGEITPKAFTNEIVLPK